jgi:hypothetical protein
MHLQPVIISTRNAVAVAPTIASRPIALNKRNVQQSVKSAQTVASQNKPRALRCFGSRFRFQNRPEDMAWWPPKDPRLRTAP